MSKIKVLIWSPHGVGEHYSGPGISAFRLYGAGDLSNIDLNLAHGSKHQAKYPDLFKNQYFISDIDKITRKNQILFLLRSFIWIFLNARKFDVVHVLGLYEISFRPALWFKKRGLKVYCKLTGEKGGLRENSRLSKLLGVSGNRKRKLNELTGFIANSTDIIKTLKHFNVRDEKIFHIPNGVDLKRFFPISPEEKAALRRKYAIPEKFTVLFVGGISKRKQPFMLVEALKALLQQGYDLQVVVVGPDRSGSEKELDRILKFVEENKLSDHFKYFGHTNRPHDFYHLADVYSLPSISEGMSNALLEAMACGNPCVVTPISGSIDLISQGVNGYLHKDLPELVEALSNYLKNPDLLQVHSANTLAIIKESYDASKLLNKHFQLFRTGNIS